MKRTKKKKPYKKQIRDLYVAYYTLNQDREFLTKEAEAENETLLDLYKTAEPWVMLYSHPHVDVVITLLAMIGWLDRYISAANSKDRTQAAIDLVNDISDRDMNEESDSIMDSLNEVEQGICVSLLFATLGNIDAMAAFGKTLDQLVIEASYDNDAIFKAVLIDRSIVAHPIIAKKISMAQMIHDDVFMDNLARSISGQRARRRQDLDEMRMMLELMDDVFDLESFTYLGIAESLIDDLQIFPDTGKDPVEALKKNIQKRNKMRRK